MSMINDITEAALRNIINIRNKSFDNGSQAVYHTTKPVISIGNLSFGGSGKTPMTIAVGKKIIEMGFTPCIIGKGYKRLRKDINLVSTGSEIVADWKSAGDEMFLIARHIAAPVIVHDKKFMAAKLAEEIKSDCIIVDDGFQHRQLHRDIDIVIIDRNTLYKPWLPPKGKLREPLPSLARADFILSHEGLDISAILPYCDKARFVQYKTIIREPESQNGLNVEPKKPVLAFSGIANPERFRVSLISKGFDVSGFFVFRDHYHYRVKDVEKIIRSAVNLNVTQVITTEKDEVKLREYLPLFNESGINFITLPIIIELSSGGDNLFAKIKDLMV